MNSIVWTVIVVAGWFTANLIGTIINNTKAGRNRFVSLRQSGDVPVQSSGGIDNTTHTSLRTSGKLIVGSPQWLVPAARALNNMRAQAPYVAAMMALAWWIERMWFVD